MAGKKPGPAPGKGGRPRVAKQKPDGGGYLRETTGPAGHGTLRYVQDVVVGAKGLGKRGKVADHRNGIRTDNRPSNVRLVSRSTNRTNQHPSRMPKKR